MSSPYVSKTFAYASGGRFGLRSKLENASGNTSGPHVCYRFWKNGRQVDPFKQKLPEAKPISSELKKRYFAHIKATEKQLNCLDFKEEKTTNIAMN